MLSFRAVLLVLVTAPFFFLLIAPGFATIYGAIYFLRLFKLIFLSFKTGFSFVLDVSF
jgi:hypothetical protein